MEFKINKKSAYTLAEVMIAMTIIGVIAATTIATFVPRINDHVRVRQVSVAKIKFTKAMEMMALNDSLGPYYRTTSAFVDELQKYLKVSKVCGNDELEECFGHDKVKLKNGKDYEVKDIKSGENFGFTKTSTEDYGETIGLITLDGTAMILSWNRACPIIPPSVYEWSNDTNYTTSCVAMVMDVNLDKTPNKVNKDIVLFGAKKLGPACGIAFDYAGQSYCWSAPFIATPMTTSECSSTKTKLGIKECLGGNLPPNADFWGGVVRECNGVNNMPNSNELAALAAYIYGRAVADAGNETHTTTSALNLNMNRLEDASLALLSSYRSNTFFKIWAGVEDSSTGAWNRNYADTYTEYDFSSRASSNRFGVCKVE